MAGVETIGGFFSDLHCWLAAAVVFFLAQFFLERGKKVSTWVFLTLTAGALGTFAVWLVERLLPGCGAGTAGWVAAGAVTATIIFGRKAAWTLAIAIPAAAAEIFSRGETPAAAAFGILLFTAVVFVTGIAARRILPRFAGPGSYGETPGELRKHAPGTHSPWLTAFWLFLGAHLAYRLAVVYFLRSDPTNIEIFSVAGLPETLHLEPSMVVSPLTRFITRSAGLFGGGHGLIADRLLWSASFSLFQIVFWDALRRRGLSPAAALLGVLVLSMMPGVLITSVSVGPWFLAACFVLPAFEKFEAARVPHIYNRLYYFDERGFLLEPSKRLTVRTGVDFLWEMSGGGWGALSVLAYPPLVILYPLLYFLPLGTPETRRFSRDAWLRNAFWIIPSITTAALFGLEKYLHRRWYPDMTVWTCGGRLPWSIWITPLLPLVVLGVVFLLLQRDPETGRPRFSAERQLPWIFLTAAGMALFFALRPLDPGGAFVFPAAALAGAGILTAEYRREAGNSVLLAIVLSVCVLIGAAFQGKVIYRSLSAWKKAAGSLAAALGDNSADKKLNINCADLTFRNALRGTPADSRKKQAAVNNGELRVVVLRYPFELWSGVKGSHLVKAGSSAKLLYAAGNLEIKPEGPADLKEPPPLARYVVFTSDPKLRLKPPEPAGGMKDEFGYMVPPAITLDEWKMKKRK